MSSRGTVVFVVDARTVGVTADDAVLADAVRRRGLSVRPVVWSSSFAVDDVVLIRSPYDYVERPAEFHSWLDDLDECGATVLNATSLLRWNGASARHTISVDGADPASLERGGAHVRRLVVREDVLVQPFVASIQTDGEVSVVVIGGEITHAVLKQPIADEWRVQSEFGGAAVRVPVTAEHERVVASVLGAVDGAPTYARVDLVGIDGEMHLMELELIEPELFFRVAPEAADRLADRLADLVLPD